MLKFESCQPSFKQQNLKHWKSLSEIATVIEETRPTIPTSSVSRGVVVGWDDIVEEDAANDHQHRFILSRRI